MSSEKEKNGRGLGPESDSGDLGLDASKSIKKGRRHFLIGAAKTAPVILTVAGRPALGAQCFPSGFASGNLSKPDEPMSCGGLSPGYWKNHITSGDWPYPYQPGTCASMGCNHGVHSNGTMFDTAFELSGSSHAGETMLQVLWNYPGSVAFHATAALLNAASGTLGYMPESMVRRIYSEWLTLGYYTTSSGIQMFGQEIKDFFNNTYH